MFNHVSACVLLSAAPESPDKLGHKSLQIERAEQTPEKQKQKQKQEIHRTHPVQYANSPLLLVPHNRVLLDTSGHLPLLSFRPG